MSNFSILPSDNQPPKIAKYDIQQANAPIEQVVEQANSAVDQAITLRRDSFLQKLFPNSTSREIMHGELALIKSEFEFRKKALQKVREAQIQSLSESLNQFLDYQKADIRANKAKFLMHKHMELQEEMEKIMDDFIPRMEIQMQKIEAISNPMLQKMREKQLFTDIEGFMRQQQILMEKFRQIIFEGV